MSSQRKILLASSSLQDLISAQLMFCVFVALKLFSLTVAG